MGATLMAVSDLRRPTNPAPFLRFADSIMNRTTYRIFLLSLLFVGVFVYVGCQNRGAERGEERVEASVEWPPPWEEDNENWSSEPIVNCLEFLDIEPGLFEGEVAETFGYYSQTLVQEFSTHSIEIQEEEVEKRFHKIQSRFPAEGEFNSFLSTIGASPTELRFAICRDLRMERYLVRRGEMDREPFGFLHQELIWQLDNRDEGPQRQWLRHGYDAGYENLLLATATSRRWALLGEGSIPVEMDHLHLVARAGSQPLMVHSTVSAITILAPDWVFIEEHPKGPIRHEFSFESHSHTDSEKHHLAQHEAVGGWKRELSTLAYINLRFMVSEDAWDVESTRPGTRTFHCGTHCPDGVATPPLAISVISTESHREWFEEAICRIDPEPRYIRVDDEQKIQEVRENVVCEDEQRSYIQSRNSQDTAGDSSRARQIYRTHCAVCHGESGQGDGLAGEGLFSDQGMDFTDPESFQHGTSPLEIFYATRDGIPESGMPAYGHLPEEELLEVAHYINRMSEEDTTELSPERLEELCREASIETALQVLDDPC